MRERHRRQTFDRPRLTKSTDVRTRRPATTVENILPAMLAPTGTCPRTLQVGTRQALLRSTHARANSNPCASASSVVLNNVPSIRCSSITDPVRPALQTDPRDLQPCLLIGIEQPEIM